MILNVKSYFLNVKIVLLGTNVYLDLISKCLSTGSILNLGFEDTSFTILKVLMMATFCEWSTMFNSVSVRVNHQEMFCIKSITT